MKKLFLACCLALIAFGCTTQDTETVCKDTIDTNSITLQLEVVRLEDELFACKSEQDIKQFITKHRELIQRYDNYPIEKPTDSLHTRLWTMVQDKDIKILYQDAKARFDEDKNGKWKQVVADFTLAFKHLKHYYPQFKVPKIYTTLTGLGSFWGGTDIYMDKECIVISLEYYYGKGVKHRPIVKGQYMPEYIWKRFVPEAIVPSCILAISNKYNAINRADKVFLAEMIAAGKAYTFVKQMMPCLADSLLTGYTQKELKNLNDKENREYVWNHLVENKVLFSNKRSVIAAYLDERPYVAEINSKCPGRVGEWLGWRIIQKYQKKHPEVSFQTLMSNQNAREIFEASGYSGQ